MNEILSVNAVMQKYQAANGEVTALEHISFTAQEGEFICIVGPSGCGKSTLLSVIAGLEKATRGSVLLDGKAVEGVSAQVGYMLQRDNLLEWRSIWKNVLLGLEIQHKLSDETKQYADELIRTYGLNEFCNNYPSQLSGGMRQRVALIRTLAVRPRILLLDEAFSALDFQTRLSVTDDVYHILKNENKTTLMVTHDIPEGISMADRMIVLSRRPAVIKNIHDISFDPSCASPLERRNNPQFGRYFNEIWRELDVIA